MPASNNLAAAGIDIVTRVASGDPHLSARFDTTRDTDGGSTESATMFGHFTRYNEWYEINSWLEGHFMERVVMGAATKTLREQAGRIVVNYDHGYDPTIGQRSLGPIEVLREEAAGVYYEVPLLDTDYNRNFILPALRGQLIDGRRLGSVLGASFRMRIIEDTWNDEPGVSAHNPQGIPERTITQFRLYEFGPVYLGASPGATAMVRCWTDELLAKSLEAHGRNMPGAPANTSAASGTDSTTPPPEHGAESTESDRMDATAIRLMLHAANQ